MNFDAIRDMSFSCFLSYKVKTSCDTVIICENEKSYTWKDVDNISSAMADRLRRIGVKEGTNVGLFGKNSINWISAFFATQKLGAVAVFINNKLTYDELRVISNLSRLTHICCDESKISQKLNIPQLDISQNFEQCENATPFYTEVTAKAPSIIFFSSGSETEPKAVMVTAYQLLNINCNLAQLFKLTENDRTCLILPLLHIFGFQEFLHSAICNACVYLPKSTRTNDILSLIQRERCTIMHSVPTLMQAIVNGSRFSEYDLSSLRFSVIAGAAALPEQIKLFKQKLPHVRFMIIYALSELGCATNTEYDDKPYNLFYSSGKVSRDVEIKIMDKSVQLPPYHTGEIVLKSPYQCLGYYGQQNQPFDDDGWLHSGDLGYLDNNGYLHYCGRLKQIINHGGEKITPLEIEKAIYKNENVEAVTVFGLPDKFWGEKVVACIVLKNGCIADKNQITLFLKDKIAEYKIPSEIVFFPSFPTLASGKVDMLKLKNMVTKILN